MTLPTPSIYNTATRSIEPVTDAKVGLYVCGVTPYDTSHLGHAFTYTVFDVLVRWLRFLGREVTYVQNVTDIDDDVLMRAEKTGDDWKRLGDREYAAFREQMANLGNLDPDVAPRATEHIPEMQTIVATLIGRGLAYESGGSAYFSVKKDPGFGKLFREDYGAMLQIANERGNFPADPLKRDPLDFVLWQHQRPGEPAWDSPWGPGRPGWHIECSAMAMKYLGNTVTVHGGGEDLIFPHHDAEIAQSENASGAPFVKHWMHAAMVYCGEHKMSKSLGNMVFVSDLLARCPADAVRLYILQHHYRQPWNHAMDADLPTCELARSLTARLSQGGEASGDEIAAHGVRFMGALADDLNTPRAIEELTILAEGTEEQRRVARALGARVLGLTFDS
ncbi:MAG: cysteine--tRNA ligase [Dehalococcoidia bacterium]